jgi:hypothetical protein
MYIEIEEACTFGRLLARFPLLVRPYPLGMSAASVAVAILLALVPNLLCCLLNENNPLSRALRKGKAPVGLLFASNRRIGVSRRTRPRDYWAWSLLDPCHSVGAHTAP